MNLASQRFPCMGLELPMHKETSDIDVALPDGTSDDAYLEPWSVIWTS